MAQRAERIFLKIAIGIAVLAVVALAISLLAPNAISRLRGTQQPAPTSESMLLDQADRVLAKGDLRAADALSHNAVARDASDATIDYRAGNIALRAGDRVAAQTFYQYGESANSRFPWNFIALGQVYAEQGKLAQADAQLRAALVAAPDLQFLHYELGAVEYKERLYAAALADFQTELRKSPSYAPAIAGREAALKAIPRARQIQGRLALNARPMPKKPGGMNAAAVSPGTAKAAAAHAPQTAQKVVVQAFPLPLSSYPRQPAQIVALAETPARRDAPVAPKSPTGSVRAATPAASRPPWSSAISAAKGVKAPESSLPAAVTPDAAPTALSQPAPALPKPESGAGVIPNVIGMTVDEARTQLTQAGFQVEHVTVLNSRARHGASAVRIINTEPEPGATTPPGAPTVNLIAQPKR